MKTYLVTVMEGAKILEMFTLQAECPESAEAMGRLMSLHRGSVTVRAFYA
jgi:hypothetical protein